MGFFESVFDLSVIVGNWAAEEPNPTKRFFKYSILVLFLLGIIAFIVWVIWRIINCSGETYYIKRDYLNLLAYSYDVRNKDNENILRVEGSFPAQFAMTPVPPKVPKDFIALDANLVDLNYLFLPEYDILLTNGTQIGKIEKKINLLYHKFYITAKSISSPIESQEIYSNDKDIPKDMYFYQNGKRIAKSVRTAQGSVIRNYKLCIDSNLDPMTKQLVFLGTIAMDQHK